MSLRGIAYNALVPWIHDYPRLKFFLRSLEGRLGLLHHSAAEVVPQLIRPRARSIDVAITAYCNLRCVGCRYGRDFMPGSQLEWPIVRDLLDDAKALGYQQIRLYGGEPLLHPDLPKMVEHGTRVGINLFVTTNGIVLDQKIDELYAAGLRRVTIGFYGVGASYDAYVQRKNRFAKLESAIEYVRTKYPDVKIQLSWLLMRPTCSLEAFHEAFRFATHHSIPMKIDLVHYSLPYFSEGPDRELRFLPEDRGRLEEMAAELLRLRKERPDIIEVSPLHLAAIPDWLLRGPEMEVPCVFYDQLWVGADGTVQLCYVCFGLGNLHENRLREIAFSAEHRKAARDAFQLNCPRCHCGADNRIQRHGPSRAHYGREARRLSA